MKQIKLPLFFAFYILVFTGLPRYGEYVQVLSVALILLQNFATLGRMGTRYWSIANSNPSIMAFMLIFVIPLQSMFCIFFTPEQPHIEYSVIFPIVILSIFITVNAIPFQAILRTFLLAAVAIVATTAIVYGGDLPYLLRGSIDPEQGLVRFSPFNLHPNLTGHMFGGFAVLFFSLALYEKRRAYRLAFWALLGASAVFCVATSSRGGNIAAVIAIACVSFFAAWKSRRKRHRLLLLSMLAGAAIAVLGYDKLADYLATIFELDSQYRGVNSGFTGRVPIWMQLLDTGFPTASTFLLGHGLRTADIYMPGYNIDNGYLNLLYEIGIVTCCLFVGLLLACINRFRKYLLKVDCGTVALVFGMFVFLIVESMVARYLLAIGNPVSLFMVFCMLGRNSIIKASRMHPARMPVIIYRASPLSPTVS